MITLFEGVVVSKTYFPLDRGFSLVEFQLTTHDLRTISFEDRYGRIPCASPLVRYTVAVQMETKCIVYVDAIKTIDAVTIEGLCAAEPNSAKVFQSARLKIKGLGFKQNITRETRDALVTVLGGAKSDEGAHLLRLVSNEFLVFHAWLSARGDGGSALPAALLHWTRCTTATAQPLPSHEDYPTSNDAWRAAFCDPEPDYAALVFEKQDRFAHPEWLTRDFYREYKEFMATTRIQGHLCVSVPPVAGDVLVHRLHIARQAAPPVEQKQSRAWFIQSTFDHATMLVRALFEEPSSVGAPSDMCARLIELSHAHDFDGMRDAIDSIHDILAEPLACYAPNKRCARELTAELGVHTRHVADTTHGSVSAVCVFYAQDFDICTLGSILLAHINPALKHVLLVGDATLPPPNYARGQIFRDALQFACARNTGAVRAQRAQHPFLATRYSVEARNEWCDTAVHFSRTAEAAVQLDVCVTDNAFSAGWRPSLGDDTLYLVADDARANALTRDLTQAIERKTWCFVPPHIGRITELTLSDSGSANDSGVYEVFYRTDFDDSDGGGVPTNGATHPFKFLHVLPVPIVPTSLRVDHVVFEVDPVKTCWADIYRVLCCARRSVFFYVLGIPDERDTGKTTLMDVLARTNVRMHHITDTSIWSKPMPAEIVYPTAAATAVATGDSDSESDSDSDSCSDANSASDSNNSSDSSSSDTELGGVDEDDDVDEK